jgi:hypothetical protein
MKAGEWKRANLLEHGPRENQGRSHRGWEEAPRWTHLPNFMQHRILRLNLKRIHCD